LIFTIWSFHVLFGASVCGVASAFLGRDFVFVLNALSFVVSAALIGSMRFDEPHILSQAAMRLRDWWDYSFLREGIHYVRRQRRLTAAVLVKAGLGATGASWIIFPIMGARVFPVNWGGI